MLFTLVNNLTRESLTIKVASSIGGNDVAEVLQRVARARGLLKSIGVDNSPQFTSKRLDHCT